ncbi:hypothetical protein BN14_01703 [Rhizoctonia solani AG-1 IB]|uniref:Uncharacterized protein n=1 Tax=Thanatephorus cucumeris (strain AG1-IB / isolate 7/3/14) TaxID=1108050 RepID=M5BLN6_THACB|nr:hypothetical protein BN14_01703 [Rhizoctonia solani AG-1 IB]
MHICTYAAVQVAESPESPEPPPTSTSPPLNLLICGLLEDKTTNGSTSLVKSIWLFVPRFQHAYSHSQEDDLWLMSYGTKKWAGWVLEEKEEIEHIKAVYEAGI